jgi:hypothetical protein
MREQALRRLEIDIYIATAFIVVAVIVVVAILIKRIVRKRKKGGQ